MVEAVVLGSGTSHGVPMLGYQYPPGYLDNPKNHRSRCSIALCGPTGNLLVDCAPELRLQAVREGLRSFEAVLITHCHADHIMGMDDLRSICMLEGRSLPIYSLPDSLADIRRVFSYAFREYPPGVVVPRFNLIEVPEWISVGGMQVRTFVVQHGKIPVIALRVGDFAYITDVSLIPEEVMPLLDGLGTLLLDAVRVEPHPNHFHLARAIEVATRIGAKQTYFTHLSHDYDHDVTNLTLPPTMQLAWDGLRVPIQL
ncbi:MAG: MBL fold metallo-hydrolase [Fimbriimonas sp.]